MDAMYNQDLQLLQEAISKVEDPRQKGMFITSDADNKCFLAMLDSHSGRLSRYDIVALSADIQIKDGLRQQIGLDELVADKLGIFLFGANFGSKAQSAGNLLPQELGTFQIYSLKRGVAKPVLLSASVAPDCQLDLTAIGVANYETKELLGLRAVFPGSLTRFGVVAITTSQEIMSLWYWEKLESASSHTLSADANEDEYDSPALLRGHQWRNDYENESLS